jgi:outer membrane murein-binding lipoprotein Lpp
MIFAAGMAALVMAGCASNPKPEQTAAEIRREQDANNVDSRVKFSLAQRANREEARVQAGLLFAAQIAAELKTYVVTAAGQTLDAGQLDIVEEITTATKVNISGMERKADFWRLVETEDPSTRAKSREYLYYVVWAMPQATWTALTWKYVKDVVGKLPDGAVQTNVARAYGDIQAAADRQTEMTDAEFQQRLRLQEQSARDAEERDWIAALSAAASVDS